MPCLYPLGPLEATCSFRGTVVVHTKGFLLTHLVSLTRAFSGSRNVLSL